MIHTLRMAQFSIAYKELKVFCFCFFSFYFPILIPIFHVESTKGRVRLQIINDKMGKWKNSNIRATYKVQCTFGHNVVFSMFQCSFLAQHWTHVPCTTICRILSAQNSKHLINTLTFFIWYSNIRQFANLLHFDISYFTKNI